MPKANNVKLQEQEELIFCFQNLQNGKGEIWWVDPNRLKKPLGSELVWKKAPIRFPEHHQEAIPCQGYFRAMQVGGLIFLIGGADKNGKAMDTNWSANVAEVLSYKKTLISMITQKNGGLTMTLHPLLLSRRMSFGMCGFAHHLLYLVGGFDGKALKDCEVYDVSVHQATRLPMLNQKSHLHNCFIWNAS